MNAMITKSTLIAENKKAKQEIRSLQCQMKKETVCLDKMVLKKKAVSGRLYHDLQTVQLLNVAN